MAMGERGHEVTLFAAKGSAKPPGGHLFETTDARMKFEDEELAYKMYCKYLDNYDVIIDDSHVKYSYMGRTDKTKIMGVLHTHPTYRTPPNAGQQWLPNFVAVSRRHALMYSGILGITILHAYNGIDMSHYKYQKNKGDRFLWVGRFEPFKGAHIAIHLARTLNIPLDIIGKTSDSPPDYVKQCLAQISATPNIRFMGEVDNETLISTYQNARAVIVPYMWDEPLGLVQLEAGACGTPVIAATMGAIPETIIHEKTGFLCTSVEEMAAAIQRIDEIAPEDCRKNIEAKFSREKMAERYEELCYKIVEGQEW